MNYRELIKNIFDNALDALLPHNFMHRALRIDGHVLRIKDDSYDLNRYNRIFVFGSGKASVEMAKSVERLLGDRIEAGCVISHYAAPSIGKIQVIKSSHPVPTRESFDAAERLTNEFLKMQKDDFFIYLLSGGSSALIEKPIPPISLDEFQAVSTLLLNSGMPIGEINVIRKHLSMIKGGRLGRSTTATGVVLVLSDVVGDDLTAIGSGPLYYDESTYLDSEKLLQKYRLYKAVPISVQTVIEKGIRGQIDDTPKTPPKHIQHYMVGNNYTGLLEAKMTAEKHGLKAHILTSQLKGEAEEAGKFIMSLGKEIFQSGNPWNYPVALIFGGETTVTVRGNGKGGRNQELALSVLQGIGSNPHFTFLSAGFDGIDGPTDAAGALADHESYKKAKELGLDAETCLLNNDSNSFFKLTHDLIFTGPTGTNACDIAILIIH